MSKFLRDKSDFAGTPDVLILAVWPLDGAANAAGIVTWEEEN